MNLETLKKIVRGAAHLAWNEGRGGSQGDISVAIPLIAKAIENVSAEEMQKLLSEAGKYTIP